MIVVVILVPLLAGVGYATLPSPLVYGGAGAIEAAELLEGLDRLGRSQYAYRFEPGGPIKWGIDVRNPLLVPVTIRGLHAAAELPTSPVVDQALHISTDPSISLNDEVLVPFEAVDLAPGESVFLVMTERFTDCATASEQWIPGSALVREDLWFDMSVLGLPRLAQLSLPFTFHYDAPAEADC